MKINYKEKSTVEIINFYNSKKISVNNIEKIYVGFKVFLFLKMYYLKIKTNEGEVLSFKFDKKNKDRIKKDVSKIRSIINWDKTLVNN